MNNADPHLPDAPGTADTDRSSEAKYRLLFEQMMNGFALHEIVCDDAGTPIDYRFLELNTAFSRMTGLAAAETIGKTVLELMPETEPEWIERYGDVALSGKAIRFEQFSGALNKYFDVTAYSPQRGQFATIIDDITERKKAEALLSDERNLLLTLINTIPDRVYVKDKECRFILNNIAHIHALGARTQEEVLGKTDHDLRRWDLANGYLADDKRVIQTGEALYNREESTILPSGDYGTILSSKVPFHDSKGEVIGLVGVSRDISNRKKIENELIQSEARFKAVSRLSSDFSYSCVHDGLEGYIVDWITDAFFSLTGYDEHDLQQKKCWLFSAHPDDRGAAVEHFNILREGESHEHEFRLVTKGGDILWVNNKIECTADPAFMGRRRIFGSVKNITAQKRAEENLRQIEERLRQSEKLEAVGQLASGIAHDFNNVLGGIIGFTDLSLDYAEKGSVLENNLSKVLKAADRAKRLVQQILTFSRQGHPRKAVTAMEPIVREVLDLLRASIPTSVNIEADLRTDTRSVLVDPVKIHEALLNLATNAVDAMNRKGTLTVRLHAERLDELAYGQSGELQPGEYTVIEISDTGSGMDAATLSRAFEPFFTTKGVGEGTGMGLSVVLGVMQSHGGDIQVQSEQGKGTTMKLYLPVSKESVSPPIDSAARMRTSGTERILFVDDEQMLVEMAQRMLPPLGYTVIGMSDSAQALAYMQEHASEIDVLVTDQTMPVMTGIELAKEIRKIKPDVAVILCTGYSLDVNPDRAAALGISRIIMKPYRAHDINTAIQEIIFTQSKEQPNGKNSGN